MPSNSNGEATAIDETQVTALATQVGGHRTNEAKAQKGMKKWDRWVLKPLDEGERSARELAFYRRVFNGAGAGATDGADGAAIKEEEEWGDEWLKALRSLVPVFKGVVSVRRHMDGAVDTYIEMEDLCAGYQRPCVGDFKIGRHTYDDKASMDKRKREESKYPWQAAVGFRITGMRVYEPTSELDKEYDRFFGRGLDPEHVGAGIGAFLQGEVLSVPRRDVAAQVVADLDRLIAWFRRQRIYRFFSASILIVYDGGAQQPQKPASATLIDFAHAYPISDGGGARGGGEIDDSSLFGLESLRKHFVALM